MRMQLNEAVSKRLAELLSERNMTQYQLFMKSGVPKSTIVSTTNVSQLTHIHSPLLRDD